MKAVLRWSAVALLALAMLGVTLFFFGQSAGHTINAHKSFNIAELTARTNEEPVSGAAASAISSSGLEAVYFHIGIGFALIFATLLWLVVRVMKLDSARS